MNFRRYIAGQFNITQFWPLPGAQLRLLPTPGGCARTLIDLWRDGHAERRTAQRYHTRWTADGHQGPPGH